MRSVVAVAVVVVASVHVQAADLRIMSGGGARAMLAQMGIAGLML
jgi:calcineurin-like phosphoesterase